MPPPPVQGKAQRAKNGDSDIKNRTLFTGDNLYVLRGIKSCSVDLIYLDPPFNSKHDYAAPIGSKAAGAAFKDTWTLSDIDEAWVGEIAEVNEGIYKILEMVREVMGKSTLSYLIYMTIRIIEMRRILKKTGTLYLHCDPTMSHYLKCIMDAIFGKNGFKNEIVWKRTASGQKGSQYAQKTFGSNHDIILVYGKDSKKSVFYAPKQPLTEAERLAKFPKIDDKGRRYNTATPIFRAPSMGPRPNLCYTWRGITNPHPSGWRLKKSVLEEEYQKGNVEILTKKDGKLHPVRKKYEKDYRGENMGDIWSDINPVGRGAEDLGYPTQKPLALLERIISSATLKGDWVLDPFCGCATACSAAEKLGRNWIGIDISEKAYDLVKIRLKREAGIERFTTGKGKIIHRTDVPIREGHRTPDIKHRLFGLQEGKCTGCHVHFEFRNLEIDHIIPRATGGRDDDSNLQLLCGSCNRIKGDRDMAYLRMRLKELGVV